MRALFLNYCRGELRMLETMGVSYAVFIASVMLGAAISSASTARATHALLMLAGTSILVFVVYVNARAAVRTLGDAQERWWQKLAAVAVITLLAAALYAAAFGPAPATP